MVEYFGFYKGQYKAKESIMLLFFSMLRQEKHLKYAAKAFRQRKR